MLNARQLNDSTSYYVIRVWAHWYNALRMMRDARDTIRYLNKHSDHNESKENTRAVSIYFAHGAADQRSAVIPLIEGMLERGLSKRIRHVIPIKYKDRRKGLGIEFFAEQIKDTIIENGDQNNDIIVIGHSCGGVEISHFVENFAKKAGINVVLAIPICAPFFGTPSAKAAAFLCRSKAMEQIQDDSNTLQNLRKQMNESDCPIICVSAGKDQMVPPDGCCPEKLNEKVFPEDDHLTILYSPKVMDLLRNICNVAAESSSSSLKEHITSICSPKIPKSKNKSSWCSLYKPALTVGFGVAGLALVAQRLKLF